MKEEELPLSKRGMHGKVYSLLDDPAIKAELWVFVRSKKWAMSPAKLQEFSQGKMIPHAADPNLCHLVNEEMPRGLKQYMELELFLQIQMKVVKGVSLVTTWCWLRSEGFRYITFNKGLYFNGHDRPDVIQYRQEVFLPAMKEHFCQLVQYDMKDVDKEVLPNNFVERPLVLVVQDEMTAQAHDTKSKSWVFND
jgi:hypothetical protein